MQRLAVITFLAVLTGCWGAPDPLDSFFSLSEIHRVEIELGRSSYEALLLEPRQYAPAEVWIDGTRCQNVGVRLKGAAGSFIPLDGERPWSGDGNGKTGKSAFIIDFNRYLRGQNYLGLKKLTLNNLVQDPSCMHEYLGYALFREAGVPASRSGFARVELNGEPKYLYALIETPDNDEFLQHWFATEDGDLFEGQYGADFYPDRVSQLDHDHGEDVMHRGPLRMAEALDDAEASGEPLEALDRYIDMDAYLSFAAAEIFLGHWDGYARSANNYMIHHHPGEDRWCFIPWGIDQLFADTMGEFGGVMQGRGPVWQGGRVHQLCFQSIECRSRLHEAFLRLFERVEAMDLSDLAQRVRDLSGPPALEESERYGDPGLTFEAQEGVFGFLAERRHQMEPWLPCLIGEMVDHDGDGYDDCTVDCRHADPRIHPDAEEACNFQDDDCDCRVDRPGCPECMEMPFEGEITYLACFGPRTWEEARADCLDRGGDLASFTRPEIANEIAFVMSERGCPQDVWIGLQRDPEGRLAWSDGSPLGEVPLAPGEGEEAGGCVAVGFGEWRVHPCSEPHLYACKNAVR